MEPELQRAPVESAPPRRRGLLAARRVAIALGALAFLLGGAAALLASETALDLVVRVLVARSAGRLSVDEPTGSLLSTVRVKRLAWKGPEAEVTADEIALTWSPRAVFSRGIVIHGLGAQRIDIALHASSAATPLPPTLALPTAVVIDSVAVGRLAWTVGTSAGTIDGIAFRYEGGARAHRVDRLSLVTPRGTVTGGVALDATAPFALGGKLALAGDAALRDATADIVVSGTLASVALDAAGRAGDANFTLRARLAPLAAVVLDEITLAAANLDLATWDAGLPATRISGTVKARPQGDALEGEVEATNAISGPIDARRLPLRSLAAHFSWRSDLFALDKISAEGGGGRATGRGRIPLTGDAGRWTLDVRDVDLRQVYGQAIATRLSGTLDADLVAGRQRIVGDVADRTMAKGVALAFAAAIADGALTVERFRIRAGGGELAGTARIGMAGERPFAVTAKATAFDPSRFGAFPAGRLDADIAAKGALQPEWRVTADIALAAGSRLTGLAASGSFHANLSPRTMRDAAIDLKLGSAALTARGGFGGADDRLAVAIDAPRLGELAPLVPARVPRPLAGALRAQLTLSGGLERAGAQLQARGESLRIGPALALATAELRLGIEPPDSASPPATGDARRITAEMSATGIVAPTGNYSRATASVAGTLAQHRIAIAIAGEDIDVEAAAHGGVRESAAGAGPAGWTWSGTVDALHNRGEWALRLAAPATLEIARDRVRVGAARVEVADGSVDLAALSWDEGRVTTRGAFAGVPVATLAQLSGYRLPFVSTLALAGEWSLAATPRLNGTVSVRRERGDFFVGPGTTTVGAADRALQITALELSARVRDDAVEASATLRSGRGVNADGELAIGAVADAPPGRITAAAPLQLALRADLATLQVLQPWIGTAAVVDGKLRAELSARGTLGRAPLSGTLSGSALSLQAPQHGVHFTDGRLEATLAEGSVRLDELSFAGGAGRFTASGTAVAAADGAGNGQGASARFAWRAERFRVFNRPDRRLVAGGAGTLAIRDRKLRIEGTLGADEGHFEYTADARVTLGDDVVIKGRKFRVTEGAGANDFPLALDLELDLGEKLTFVGEGLDTGLRGKVRVTTAPDGSLRGRGTIRAVNGTYRAYGQRLAIDRGNLVFDGPIDNPGLDIVALRKNLAVEAGVIVSGTVRVPIVQLTSNPPVPDNEKLSWLVLGRGLDRTSGADVAALQAASAALLGRSGKPVTSSIAESVGLDDISVHSGTGVPRGAVSGASPVSGQVVAFGKRLSDNLSLVYEQGLTIATNALRLEYSLTPTLTLRAEAGGISGIGIYYRRTFE